MLRESRTAAVWQMERELRLAKAVQLEWMHRFHDDYVAESCAPFVSDYETAQARGLSHQAVRAAARLLHFATREAERAAIMLIAEAVNRSEFVVAGEYDAVNRAKQHLPKTWKAFTEGRICDFRLRKITAISHQLTTTKAIAELDDEAPAFAETHRIGQLDSWLNTLVHTAEPVHASQRFARAARERRVTVTDVEDGMSVLTAIIPTLTARAIQRRLEVITRSPVHPVPHNPMIPQHTFALEQDESFAAMMPHGAAEPEGLRVEVQSPVGQESVREATAVDDTYQHLRTYQQLSTDQLPTTREAGDTRNLEQRAADAFCAWILNAETPEGFAIDAQIGIIVTEATLTGRSHQPATTRDGTACIPAGTLQALLAHQASRFQWYQLLYSADDDLLAIRSSGRYPPPRLRTAIWFRDRTCTADGCTVPAERCDADHIVPFEHGGPTTADNLQLLCRRHHRLKSWGYPIRADYLHTVIPTDFTAAA